MAAAAFPPVTADAMKFFTSLSPRRGLHGRCACRDAAVGCAVAASALCWAAGGAPSAVAETLTAASPSPAVHRLLLVINQYRRQNGLVPLEPAPELELLALQHSNAMATLRRASHAGFTSRFERADSDLCVENVAAGFATAEAAVAGWRVSPPHDRNLLEPRLRRVGIASVDRYITVFACDTAGVPAPAPNGRVAALR